MAFKERKCRAYTSKGKKCKQPIVKGFYLCRMHLQSFTIEAENQNESSAEEKTLYREKKKAFNDQLGEVSGFDEQIIHMVAAISVRMDMLAKDGASNKDLVHLNREIIKILKSLKETRDTRDPARKDACMTLSDFTRQLEEMDRERGILDRLQKQRQEIFELEEQYVSQREERGMPIERNIEHKADTCERCNQTGPFRKNEDGKWVCISCGNISVVSLLRNPLFFGELFLSNRDLSPRRYRWYQVEDLQCDARQIVHKDGRNVGKTINLATMVLWFTYVNKGKSLLVAAPYQSHVDTIVEEIEFQIEHNKMLARNVAKDSTGRMKIKRKPYFQIQFKNNCMAYFRPAGARGESFRSLHVDYLFVDEASWMPEAAWKALRQCLNPGGWFRVYSTPNGLRDRTYYELTQSKDWTLFHWPSWYSDSWTSEQRKELIDFYGGENTSDYQHEVAGKHGRPTYGAFNTDQVMNALTEIESYRRIDLEGSMFSDCANESLVLDRIQTLLNLPGGHGIYWLGADLGYTSDPSEIVLFEEDPDNVLHLVLRVHALHVAYPIIADIIAFIDRIYCPAGLGIDRGGNGTSVEHELLHLDKFQENLFTGRLVGYDFGGSITVGEDDMGRPIRKRTKEHMTQLINKLLYSNQLRLPIQDKEIENQFCSHTYTMNERGGIIYSKGDDHVIDATRCALLRRTQETDPNYDPIIITPKVMPVLTGPIFW